MSLAPGRPARNMIRDAVRRFRYAVSPPRPSLGYHTRQIPDAGPFRSIHEVMHQRCRMRNHAAAEGASVPRLRPREGGDGR